MPSPESKFLAVVRHGELDNPRGTVYARDRDSKPEDIMHINALGISQLRLLGEVFNERGMKVSKIYSSPSTRALESAKELSSVLGNTPIVVNEDLDDTYAPGPYQEKMTMEELVKAGGNVYEGERWEKYHHERPEAITERMHRAADLAIQELNEGGVAVLMSHGDPIAFFLNTLNGKGTPAPSVLRDLVYPAKGEATIVKVDDKGTMAILYTLPDTDSSLRKIY